MWELNENLFLNLIACIFSAAIPLGLTVLCVLTGFWRQRGLYRAFLLLTLSVLIPVLLYMQTWLCLVRGDLRGQTGYFFTSQLVSGMIFLCFNRFLLALTEKGIPRPLFRLVILLSVLCPVTEGIVMGMGGYSYDARGYLVFSAARGTGLSNCITVGMGLCTLLLLLYSSRFLGRGETMILLLFSLLPVVSETQMSWKITPTYVIYALSLLLIYQIICRRRARYRIKQKKALLEKTYQLSESRFRLMSSQIQPHFLYNSLTAIAALCTTDPKKAREVTLDFSQYLSRNLEFMQEKEPIPFSKELEFITLYTNIERARFGDRLRMEYAIGATAFSIPALTVQPLVENAIRHGVTVRPTGGTVRVSTEEREDCFSITVRDDGMGFNQGEIDWSTSGDHYGINYIRTRIREQMGGTLTITSRQRQGTTAEITLPKEMRL